MRVDDSDNQLTNNPLTEKAFEQLRANLVSPRPARPTAIRLDDEYERMPADQMEHWQDGGPIDHLSEPPEILPVAERERARLWVVGADQVVHALKKCAFGVGRKRGELKHTNLTGGDDAFCGGELIILDESTVVVNGDSGRYGPQTVEEINLVLRAFSESGHRTYTTGYDGDAGVPLPLTGVKLVRVA